ncbi:MAG: retropepsin-like aspartic protease [Proteobacteria bacterium]|nr:retropepsin-like aspartic protease [Pseudomonadota bacterium]
MDTRRTGQGMMTIGVILGMVMLTWFFAGGEEKQRNPNMNPESQFSAQAVEVPLKQNRWGHYLVTGAINGEPVDFLLDTGATDVVIPEATAQRLNLPYGRAGKAMTANGPVTVYQTVIGDLEIGGIHLRNVRASINPGMGDLEILLGMSALRQIEFTQQGEMLTLRQHSG